MKPPLPKEHGAWGMLLLPLAAGLIVGRAWDVAAALCAMMVFFAYVTRAPLESLARGRHDRTNWAWLATYAVLALIPAAALTAWLGRTAWLWVVVAVVPPLGITLVFAARKQSREVVNELLGAVFLPSVGAMGYAVGRSAVDGTAILLWCAFALYNTVTVPYIRTWVMARRAARNETYAAAASSVRRAAYITLVAAAVLLTILPATGRWPLGVSLAFLPGAARILLGLPRAGRDEVPINVLGWREMAHAVTFAALVTWALLVAPPGS